MSRRGCCCFGICPICEHVSFSEGLPGLEQVAGTWSVGESGGFGFLKEAGTLNAIILCDEQAEIVYQRIEATLSEAGQVPGAIIRLIIDYIDEDNYHYCNFEENAFEIFRSPSTSLVRSTAAGWANSREIFLCSNKANQLIAGVEADIAMACATPISGLRGGIGNGSSAEIRIEQFSFSNGEDHPENCAKCCCHRCHNTCVPRTLTVTVVSDDCSDFPDGQTFSITNTWDCSASQGNWTASGGCWTTEEFGSTCGWYYPFRLSCGWDRDDGVDNWQNWRLEFQNSGEESCLDAYDTPLAPSDGTCDPFYLKFDIPFVWGGDEAESAGCCSPGIGGTSGDGFISFEIT